MPRISVFGLIAVINCTSTSLRLELFLSAEGYPAPCGITLRLFAFRCNFRALCCWRQGRIPLIGVRL